jgi:hypothetical protein
MATTTNYGWTTPDDTALVKDGAAAIRTLGSSVDTSVKALSPGTTAGDLDYYTTSTAKARIGIGTTGQVLTVSGGVPAWATSTSGGMTLLSTTTLNGTPTTTISSIPATYNELWLYIQNPRPATNNINLTMRFNSDTGLNYFGVNTTVTASGSKSNLTYQIVADALVNTDDKGALTIRIPNYANTAAPKLFTSNFAVTDGGNTGNFRVGQYQGVWNNSASAISSISFLQSSGNLTSGTVLLYGVK